MARKPSNKPKTTIIRETRKNGDIYVYERVTIYDPERGYARTIQKKLIGKIPKGGTEIIKTRPKASSKKKAVGPKNEAVKDSKITNDKQEAANDSQSNQRQSSQATFNDVGLNYENYRVVATVNRTGMMDIIEFIGTESGIDNAVYLAAPDEGTAQKIISLARYILANDGRAFSGIVTWQLNHKIPYAEGISEDIYHALFSQLGYDISVKLTYSKIRIGELKSLKILALDSTTISTYSVNIDNARFGYNKDGDDLKTVKYLTIYSVETGQPVAYAKQPGNVPDVVSVENALKELDLLGVSDAELCMDNGFYSSNNVVMMVEKSMHFLMLVKNNLTWVKPLIDTHRNDLTRIDTMCPFEPTLHGITIQVERKFRYTYCESGEEKHRDKLIKIYLHIYYSSAEAASGRARFESEIHEIRQILLKDPTLDNLPASKRNKANEYLIIKHNEETDEYSVDFNIDACTMHQEYSGIFCLISDDEADTFSALKKYRKRESIEDYFQMGKGYADSDRTRVWSDEVLEGRMFVQFIGLSYREYFATLIERMKKTLASDIENDSISKTERIYEKKLLSWVKNFSLHQQLTWFDAIETTEAHVGAIAHRWSTETLKQDNRYLRLLGMIPNGYPQ